MDKLWYRRPAKAWKEALPLGNGHMGIMVYGGKRNETLAINDGNLWSGYPKSDDNPQSLENLNKVRELIFDGENAKADALAEAKLTGGYSQSFLPLGEIGITISKCGRRYSRTLDMARGIHSVEYNGGVRETLVSFPDKVAIYHIKAQKSLSIAIKLRSKMPHSVLCDEGMYLVGNAPDSVTPNYVLNDISPIKYTDKLGMAFGMGVVADTDGEVKYSKGKMKINKATKIDLYISTRTGFRGFDKMPNTDKRDIAKELKEYLDNLDKKYDIIKSRHMADCSRLYKAQTFSLYSADACPTDKLVKSAKSGKAPKSLIETFYNFGKYLAIAGSREGGQPLNLQGLWNNSMRPPWSSNYTTNINAQMNYWGLSQCNLADCIPPFIRMIDELRECGSKTAKINYGCEGFCSNHNVDIWRKSSPVIGSANYMYAPLCGSWLANELYEHLSYGQLEKYRKDIERIVIDSARFCCDYLVSHEGKWVVCPSTSPENVFTKNGNQCKMDYASAFDMAVVEQNFINLLAIDTKSELSREVALKLANLHQYTNGVYGINEWHESYPTKEVGHRHFSPLYAFHPGRVMGYHSHPTQVQWIRELFDSRLANATQYFGWSGAWATNIAGRLHDGDKAIEVINNILAHAVFKNLFDMHPPYLFQIDGNMGFLSGVNELLVGVEDGVVELLPALPKEWDSGSMSNIRIVGGQQLSFEWRGGKVYKLSVLAGDIKLRTNNLAKGIVIEGNVTLV